MAKRTIRETTPERRAELDELEALIDEERSELEVRARTDAERAKALGRRLREAREASGLSPKDVAERCGMDEPSLSRLENGERNPTVAVLERYAAALGKSLDVQLVDVL